VSRRLEHNTMDELPELRSDADVDALMARLRTKVAPAPAPLPSVEPPVKPAVSDDAVRDLAAPQDGFAAAVVRAMLIMAETLEEFEADAHDHAPSAAASASTRRSGGKRKPLTPRKGARRKAR
jgi:hypothetical protein